MRAPRPLTGELPLGGGASRGHRQTRVCRYIACVTSSCGLSILMEETAKAIPALNPAIRPRDSLGRFARSALPKTLVRSSLVIVLDELVQHPRQMMPPEDQ